MELERIACLQSSTLSTVAMSIKADDGRTYLFATAQYLDGVREANPAKWLYIGATMALFGLVPVSPIAALMGYVGAHALEYFVIVYQSLGRRYADAGTREGAHG